MMYQAISVAKYVITQCNRKNIPVSNLKLQKMLYFAWVEYYRQTKKSLFNTEICAWQLGPVVPDVYYYFCSFGGRAIMREYLNEIEHNDTFILDSIIDKYKNYTASQLVDITHEAGSAWDVVYANGWGNRSIIPFDLIIQKECRC